MLEKRNQLNEKSAELEQKMYACWLDTIYWLSGKVKYKLLESAGSAKEIYNMTEAELTSIIGLKCSERFLQHRKRCEPQRIWNYIAGIGISYTCCQTSDFPEKLANIPDPPFGIFYKGSLPDENVPSVAMIGARKCSEYGRGMAEHFARVLASEGVNIISGMALGIDGISQTAAIRAGGNSYAVLGCGVDIVYPRANEALYGALLKNGGILSEYPPQMEPKPFLFPPRNRIISALSDVILVVEAREKSGTLITVDMALEQGKEVYVIPGRCTDGLSTGCNRLLRQGASTAITPEDIMQDMNWKKRKNEKETAIQPRMNLSAPAQELYVNLDILPLSRDEVIKMLREKGSAYTVPQICQALVELELKGIALCQNGQYSLTVEAAFNRQN